MVGNSATRLACEFRKPNGAVTTANMKPQGGRSIGARRSAAYRAAPRQAKTVKPLKKKHHPHGGWMSEKYFFRSGEEKCFSLDIPFYRTF
jgi:hypothetical protein